jgi:hypothetical protein
VFAFRLPRLITVLGIVAICMGATTDSCSINNGNNGGSSDNPDFVTDLKLQDINDQITDSFAQAETITLVLTVRNRLDTAATVQFTTGRTFDFVVVRENTSEVVWKWSTGRPFSQSSTELNFAANETKTFTFDWNQQDNNRLQLPSGDYEARGVLVYSDFDTNPLKSNQLASTLVRFTIR